MRTQIVECLGLSSAENCTLTICFVVQEKNRLIKGRDTKLVTGCITVY